MRKEDEFVFSASNHVYTGTEEERKDKGDERLDTKTKERKCLCRIVCLYKIYLVYLCFVPKEVKKTPIWTLASK